MSVLAALDAVLPEDAPKTGRPRLQQPAGAVERDAEPVPYAQLPAFIRRVLDEAPGDDRSTQAHALVSSLVELGFRDEQVRAVLVEHDPSAEKYGDRLEAEVARLLGKVRPRHDHAGQPCDQARCDNKPTWMKGKDRAGDPEVGTSDADPAASWQPVDLGPYLDGSYEPPVPCLLSRSDGAALLYPGRVHWLSGEPEA